MSVTSCDKNAPAKEISRKKASVSHMNLMKEKDDSANVI